MSEALSLKNHKSNFPKNIWWAGWGLIPRPPAREAGVHTTELPALYKIVYYTLFRIINGLSLIDVCKEIISYRFLAGKTKLKPLTHLFQEFEHQPLSASLRSVVHIGSGFV